MDVKSSRPITIAEAKDILSKRKEEGELGYEQAQALDNCDRFARLNAAKTAALVKTLTENGRISEDLAIKIADVWPSNPATLRAIIVKYKVELSEEEINRVMKELS